MFCDMVDATALSSQLDPEDLRDVIHAYQAAVRSVVEPYDGWIAQYLGDGLLIYFGYPQAHEDDGERAVHAALDILQAIRELGARLAPRLNRRLLLRIGIHSGVVVIGVDSASRSHEALAIGETPNIAARLQAQAAPDSAVISLATARLLGGRFLCQSIGELQLKGIPYPVAAATVLGRNKVGSRFDAASVSGLTPLVGRAREIELLSKRWNQTLQGKGQAVLIGGEPGLGKSRLLHELRGIVALTARQVILFQCSPFHTGSVFHPLIRQLEAALALPTNASASESLDRLEQFVLENGLSPRHAQLLGQMMGLPTFERYPEPASPSAQHQKEDTVAAAVDLLLASAASTGALVLFEDAHWSDPSTLEFIELLIKRLRDGRLMLALTHRPGFSPGPVAAGSASIITLAPLGRTECVSIVSSMARGRELTQELLDKILARTDGLPLYVEELTRSTLESAAQSAPGLPGAFGRDDSRLVVPATLRDSLASRLDREPHAKEIAQLGATIGREFSRSLLAEISSLEPQVLEAGLQRLVASGLASAGSLHTDTVYIFKHALIQEAAYDSMLRQARVDIHRRIALTLEARTQPTAPELLAHHFGRAQIHDKEIAYWRQAALRAMASSAFIEARSHFRAALASVDRLPEPKRHREELELQVHAAVPLTLTLGWAAAEVRSAYERASELCGQVDDSALLFPVLHGIFRYYLVNGEHRKAEELALRDLGLAEQHGDPGVVLEFELHLGVVKFYSGRAAAALPHLERCVALYDRELHRNHSETFAACPATIASAHRANALALLGRPADAFASNEQSVAFADHSRHHFSRIWGISNHAMNHILYENHEACGLLAKRMYAQAEEHSFVNWMSQALVWLGWSKARGGDAEAGLEKVNQGIAIWDMTGARLMRPFYLALKGECLLLAGRLPQAHEAIEESFEIIGASAETWTQPMNEILRTRILLAERLIEPQAAQARLETLADACRARGEWLWVLKAEQQRLLLRREHDSAVDTARLRCALAKFGDTGAHAVLRDAAALIERQDLVQS
jgi:class 3 adenylate cyclase/predicted ATPase